MDKYIEDKINNTISSFTQLPYLFIGTGLSMRYSHAPNWNNLLFDLWKMINPDKIERDYKRLTQGIEMSLDNKYKDLPPEEKKYYVNSILASQIEEQFCKLYYSSSDFESTVFTDRQNDEIINNHYNPFKYYVAQKLSLIKLDSDLPDYHELVAIKQNENKFAGVITTNYDSLLENIFPDFSVMIGQDNLLLSNSLNIFEIFKIHGCSTNPNSIILTEDDYLTFDRKLKYLSAKLLTIFVEHPIIFIGYGLGDVNIRKLFKEIAECLTPDQLEKIKDNFIFISPAFDQEESITKREIIFGNTSIVINEFILKDYQTLYKAFSNIQSSMPIKLARKLQDMVCNFVYSAEAKNNIIFGDIDSPDIDDDKAAIFFGRADTVTNIGFSYFTINEILEDVIFDNKPYLINVDLIEKTFKNIRSSAGTTLLPIYKYTAKLNYSLDRIPQNYNIIKSYEDIRPTTSERKSYIKPEYNFNEIEEIEKACPNHIPKQVAYIKKFAEQLETEDLGNYLRRHFGTVEYTSTYSSHFKRLAALYDFKKYSPQ